MFNLISGTMKSDIITSEMEDSAVKQDTSLNWYGSQPPDLDVLDVVEEEVNGMRHMWFAIINHQEISKGDSRRMFCHRIQIHNKVFSQFRYNFQSF